MLDLWQTVCGVWYHRKSVAEMSLVDEEDAKSWNLTDLKEPDWYDPFELAFDVLVEIVGSRITEDETL